MDKVNTTPLPGNIPVSDRVAGRTAETMTQAQAYIGDQNLGTTNYESDPNDDKPGDTVGD